MNIFSERITFIVRLLFIVLVGAILCGCMARATLKNDDTMSLYGWNATSAEWEKNKDGIIKCSITRGDPIKVPDMKFGD